MANKVDYYEGIDTVRIHFEEEEKLKPQELSSFLYHSKIIYSYLYQQMIKNDIQMVDFAGFEPESFEIIQSNREQVMRRINRDIPKYGWQKLNLATKELEEEDLYIESLRKESPFSIEFIGILVLILFVISISGGNARLKAVPPEAEIEINKTLGEGLQDLKEVFSEDDERE